MNGSPPISFEGVCKVFGEKPERALVACDEGKSREDILEQWGNTVALHNINLDVLESEIFVIMGLSGSGKSTAIRHINRLVEPTRGAIKVFGEDILGYDKQSLQEFRRTKAAMVFQNFGLLPHRTVLENIVFGLKVKNIPKEKRLNEGMSWIEKIGLVGYEHSLPKDLSGGMQQRVGLGRALASNTPILLMDEAFSALDPLIRTQMQDQLLELQRDLKKTIVFITHDLKEALRIGNRIAILQDGRLVQTGTPKEIITQPANQYIKDFTKGIDVSMVLSAKDVMEEGVAAEGGAQTIAGDYPVHDVVKVFLETDQETVNVVSGDTVIGCIRKKNLSWF